MTAWPWFDTAAVLAVSAVFYGAVLIDMWRAWRRR